MASASLGFVAEQPRDPRRSRYRAHMSGGHCTGRHLAEVASDRGREIRTASGPGPGSLFHRKSHAAERVNHGMGCFIAHASCEQYAGFWIISITVVSNRTRRKETSRAKQFIPVYTLVQTDSRVATIMAQSSSRVRPFNVRDDRRHA